MKVHESDIKVINASMETGIDTVREKVLNFIRVFGHGQFKYVLLDEVDRFSPQAQDSLKNMMEEYMDVARFCLTSNAPHRITEAVRGRCQEYNFRALPEAEFQMRMLKILMAEGIEADMETLDAYTKSSHPNLRKCLNMLQQNSTTGKLLMPSSTSANAGPDYLVNVLQLFKTGQTREARKYLVENARMEDYDEIWTFLYRNLDLWGKTPEQQDTAIEVIRDGMAKQTLVADKEINLSATLVALTRGIGA